MAERIGIDLGGTKIEGVVLAEDGRGLARVHACCVAVRSPRSVPAPIDRRTAVLQRPPMGDRLSRRDILQATVLATMWPTQAAAADVGCLDALLGRRRMVRRFAPHPLPTATIRRVIAAAVRAPSAGHTQPWEFVVVRDRKRRIELAEAAFGQTFVADAPVVIVPSFDVARVRPRYGARAERYGMIDAAFASLCLLLAVTDAGLGACFVGAIDDARVARVVALPSHVRPLAVVPIGYPAETPSRRRVRRPRDVVHLEQWRGQS